MCLNQAWLLSQPALALFFPTHRPWDTMTKYLHTRCAVPPSPACQRMGRACHWGVKQYQVLPAGTTPQLPPSSQEVAGARPGVYKHRPTPSTHARAGTHPEHAQMNPSLQLCPGVGTSARFMCSSAAGKTAPSPAEAHLNISVTSPFAKATRSGNPMQAGTRYSSAGCGEEKQLLNQTTNHPLGGVQGELMALSPLHPWCLSHGCTEG